MTIQQIVSPEKIETELLKIWEDLSKENKMRASLFNLVIFNKLSKRTDYIRNIVQKVVEKFPCRTLFISEDTTTNLSYLKTAVSVLMPTLSESSIACDLIDIGVAGKDLEKIPLLILPHLLPDLPIYVLWSEDPTIPHPLFSPLTSLATRVIFDSECADDLSSFAKTLIHFKETTHIDIADLNWARTQGWRDLIASTFASHHRLSDLNDLSSIQLTYNARESDFFCHVKIQGMYLLAWLSNRLGWKNMKLSKNGVLQFQSKQGEISAQIASAIWEKLGSGTVISVSMTTKQGQHFQAERIPERYHYVKIAMSSENSCELPYEFVLGQTATGASLVKEICTKETSIHFLEMLKDLSQMNLEQLC